MFTNRFHQNYLSINVEVDILIENWLTFLIKFKKIIVNSQ